MAPQASTQTTINLQQPNTNTVEEDLAGNSPWGSFSLRDVRAASNSPDYSSTCSGGSKAFFPSISGGAVFRFQDGSLLTVTITGGGDCIDFAAFRALRTLTYKITGGTGRFKSASGELTLTEAAVPTVLDVSSNPVLTTEAGDITGTISRGVGRQDEQQ